MSDQYYTGMDGHFYDGGPPKYIVLMQGVSLCQPGYLCRVDGLCIRYNVFREKRDVFQSISEAEKAIESFIGADTKTTPHIGGEPKPQWRWKIIEINMQGDWYFSYNA